MTTRQGAIVLGSLGLLIFFWGIFLLAGKKKEQAHSEQAKLQREVDDLGDLKAKLEKQQHTQKLQVAPRPSKTKEVKEQKAEPAPPVAPAGEEGQEPKQMTREEELLEQAKKYRENLIQRDRIEREAKKTRKWEESNSQKTTTTVGGIETAKETAPVVLPECELWKWYGYAGYQECRDNEEEMRRAARRDGRMTTKDTSVRNQISEGVQFQLEGCRKGTGDEYGLSFNRQTPGISCVLAITSSLGKEEVLIYSNYSYALNSSGGKYTVIADPAQISVAPRGRVKVALRVLKVDEAMSTMYLYIKYSTPQGAELTKAFEDVTLYR